jgi:hypothetical protein
MKLKHLAITAVAALAAAACADNAPTPLSPDGAPSLAKTNAEVVGSPRFVAGNIAGEGNSVCMNLAVNRSGRSLSGVKIDPPRNATIAGYSFTLSSSGQLLSFTRVTAGYDIAAVVVKGGDDTFVYEYPAGTTSGTALQSPLKNGNVPQISHYVVCFTPTPPPPTGFKWTLEKRVVAIWTDDAAHNMVLVPASELNPLIVPANEVRWIEYQIVVTRTPGGTDGPTAVLTDFAGDACNGLGHPYGGILCMSPVPIGDPARGLLSQNYTWPTLTGNFTVNFYIDAKNVGFMPNDINKSSCGITGNVINKAQLVPSSGATLYAQTITPIATPACPAP